MRKRVLVTTQMMVHDQARFDKWLSELGYQVDFLVSSQNLNEEQCLAVKPIYDGWIAGDDQITASVLNHFLPTLKIISKWGTGIDSIDLDYASANGVEVRNSPGAFKDAVGEMALAYLLCLTRGILRTHIAVAGGHWPKYQHPTLVDIEVGIIGLGAIGAGVANRIAALGGRVCYSDPKVENNQFDRLSLDMLVKRVDAVIITCDLNASTYHLVDKVLLSKFKRGMFIVNVSRGQLINEPALCEALSDGTIAGAALDVFESEPIAKDNKLLKLDNIILGSHNANNTRSAVEYVHTNTIEQLDEVLR